MAAIGIEAGARHRLGRDPFRTLLAIVATTVTLGGWIYALSKADLRNSISQQPPTWWFEQMVILVQALLCIAVARKVVWARRPALTLTGATLLITTLAWVQGMQLTGRHPLPFTPILHAMLLWRLARSSAPSGSSKIAA